MNNIRWVRCNDKIPHTFVEDWVPAYYGYAHCKILYEVFRGLLDRTVLLNNRERSLTKNDNKKFPDIVKTVNTLLDQMLNFACK